MSLLVDVREVPWRILETVQARILANRERMKRRAQAEKVRGLTRPRPQQRGIGATMSTYKRPEPLPLVLGDDLGVVPVVWFFANTPIGRRVTLRNGSGSASVTFDIPRAQITFPANLWFNGASGSDSSVSGGPIPDSIILGPSFPAPPSATETSVQREQVVGTSFGWSDDAIFLLPVSARAAVFVCISKSRAEGFYAQATSTQVVSYGLRDIAEGVSLYGTAFTNTAESSVVELSDSTQTAKCYLVSSGGIKEVPPPAGLAAAVAGLMSDSSTFETYAVNAIRGNPVGSSAEFIGVAPNGNVYITATGDFNYPPWRTYTAREIPTPSTFVDYWEAIPLLSSYGIGNLVSDYHPSLNGVNFYSPGMFSFLTGFDGSLIEGSANYDNWFDAGGGYDTYSNYSNLRAEYLASAPAASRFLSPCSAPATACPADAYLGSGTRGTDTTSTFDFTATTPTRINEPMAADAFSRGTARARINVTPPDGVDSPKVAVAWDWGRPAYCRQQLLALGFTAEDLRP
jgi:hypothetical protein